MIFLLLVTATNSTPSRGIACDNCATWNQKQTPFRVFGNTYYVGVRGLSAILVTSDKGHILFDGDLPQSAPLIEASISALGFSIKDVKFIAVSHAHFDHVGGVAQLQKDSGAEVLASAWNARTLTAGQASKDDPQFGVAKDFPPVDDIVEVADGDIIRTGDIAITAVMTPGHTPGGTSWRWQSCEKERCLNVFYADSLSPVSAKDYRFAGAPADILQRSIERVAGEPCDILLTVHPEFSDMMQKHDAQTKKKNPFINKNACADYANAARERLQEKFQ